VTLLSDEPCSFSNESLGCVVTKIMYAKPLEQICDWDDGVKVIRWVDVDTGADRRAHNFYIVVVVIVIAFQ